MGNIDMQGLAVVIVDKDELIKTLKANLEVHKAKYVTAKRTHKEAVIKTLQKGLRDARQDKLNHLMFSVPRPPEDNHDKYEALIRQLEMDTRNQVVLGQEEFRSYVLDQWTWAKRLDEQIIGYTAVLGKP